MSDSGDDVRRQEAQNAGGGQPNTQPQQQATGGQPAAGQAPPVQQESLGDKVKDPVVQEFAKGVGALYTIAGIGLGLLVVAFGFVANPVVVSGSQADAAGEVPEIGAYFAQQYVNGIAQAVVQVLPLLAVAGALVVGIYAARSVDADDRTTYIAAAAGSLVGSVLMVVLGSYLAGSQVSSLQDAAEEAQSAVGSMDQPPEAVQQVSVFSGPEEYTVQFVDLVINSVVVGVVAAVIAVATAYAYRNYRSY